MFLYSRLASRTKSKSATADGHRPIETIPTEILILIFKQFCYASTSAEPSSTPQLHLAQICHHWRSVVLDLPTLWTKLAVSSRTPPHIVSTHLQRSQQLSLDVEVDLRHDATDMVTHERVLTTWNLLQTTAFRWHRLVLQIGPHVTSEISEDLRKLGTPLLQELRISSSSHVSGLTTLLGGGAPSLKSLQLIGISATHFTLPLDQVTRLNLSSNSSMSFSAFHSLLSNMPNLKELTLRSRVVEAWPVYPSEEDMVILPSLTTLMLSDRRWPLFVPLLSISAPNLRTLSLHELVAHDLPEIEMESHLSNNFPSITNLLVKGNSSFIDDSCFSQLSRIFPTIEHFALAGVDEFFVQESARSLHEPTIWPRLRSISMTSLSTEDMLCSLISARTKPTKGRAPLKTLAISIPSQLKRADWIRQQVNVEEYWDPSSPLSSNLTSELSTSHK